MTEGAKKMGEMFRSKREEMSLTLKEVENATSIRMIYLQAIEEGRVEHFLSNVYANGFIRQYASFLGLESDKLLKEFPDALKKTSEKQHFAYGIGTLEARGTPNHGTKWIPNVVWGVGFIIVSILAWYFAKFIGIF